MKQKPSSTTTLNFLEQLKRTKLRAGGNAAAMPDLTGRIIFDRVTVGKAVHDGGESRLYRAVAGDGTELAVKQYRRKDPVKPEVLAKLQAVSSPHVGKILAAGEVQGSFVTVMPFYEGMSLREALRQGVRFSDGEILEQLLPPVLDALHAIHEAGILHRDLKPDNIILCVQAQRVVLVDFGIASSAGDGTVVVTETGNTALYSAPETFAGAWLRESDYYSLGITLYELATGVTPYQSSFLTPEELRRYAMVSRIPYPNDFPERLRHLIDGLTYKDITRRHDLDSPDRRWGYEDVARFLRGEDVPVPGTGIGTSSGSLGGDPGNGFSVPYPYKGRKYGNSHDLAIALLTDWEGGKREMMRELLADHYDLLGMNTEAELCRNTVRDVETGKTGEDVAFFRLMYSLGKPISGIYWKEFFFESIQDYGNKLIDAATAEIARNNDREKTEPKNTQAVSGKGTPNQHPGHEAIILMDTVSQFLIYGLLKNYVSQAETSVREHYSRIIELSLEMLCKNSLGILRDALRLGYNLTGRTDFILGDRRYSAPSELTEELDHLNQKDIIKYVTFYRRYLEQARSVAEVLPSKCAVELSRHFPVAGQNICLSAETCSNAERAQNANNVEGTSVHGVYAFRNFKDLLSYEEALFDQGNYVGLYAFRTAVQKDYSKNENEMKIADPVLYARNQSRFQEMVCINGIVYPNVNALTEYYRQLRNFELPAAEVLASSGMSDIIRTWKKTRSAKIRTQLNECFQIPDKDLWDDVYSQLSPGNKFIKFGRYWISSRQKKESLKWKVLVHNENSVLLITERGIDARPYHVSFEYINWADCTLRKWLNEVFLLEAFDINEQELLLESRNENHLGPVTHDRLFLLSEDEAEKYLLKGDDWICSPTSYAINRGAYFSEYNGSSSYWLRNTGFCSTSCAPVIFSDGRILGTNVNRPECVVRPAILLKLPTN